MERDKRGVDVSGEVIKGRQPPLQPKSVAECSTLTIPDTDEQMTQDKKKKREEAVF